MCVRPLVIVALVALPQPAVAAETITYTYDARGRLLKVVRNGSVNNNIKSDYAYDAANNRTRVKITGAP